MCKHAVRILLHLIRYVPDKYMTQMRNKAILQNGGTLTSVPHCQKQLMITLMH